MIEPHCSLGSTPGISAVTISSSSFAQALIAGNTPELCGRSKLKVFFMSVGTEDPRLPFQKLALEDFQKHGVQPIFKTYAGAHEWKVWRHSLADFAPMLFR